jgi:quinoprotein dehydrogenase-associated probable ABC transporter substrate-binding protein
LVSKRLIIASLALASAAVGLDGRWLGDARAIEGHRSDLVNREVLRICADPANLPFSNDKKEGFENKIANIIGEELKVPVEYTWFPQVTGFIRNTLGAKRCDLVIGTGQGDETLLNTNAIYSSAYALLYKPNSGLDGVDSLFDPRLKGKHIGVVAGTPPSNLIAKAGLMGLAKPFHLVVDRRYDSPAEDMVKDIRSGELAAGVLWGPIAGYFATKGGEKLTVVPLLKDAKTDRLVFRITMGVRQGDDLWKRQLNDIIRKRQGDIDRAILEFGVPLLDDDGQPVTKPRANG